MKLFYYKKEEPLNYFNSSEQVEIPDVYSEKEIRGLWVSNVLNIDLPTISDEETYKKKVIEMLDTCLRYHINTIFFQVRCTNDAFYESKLNPYSRYLTGVEGQKPPFDVLKWLLSNAKERNIAVHAWMNPYRVSSNKDLSKSAYLQTCSDLNFAKQNPDLVLEDVTGVKILNPGSDKVKNFIIATALEVVNNYEVAGIHFDDYFYPYSEFKDDSNDSNDYSQRSDRDLSLGEFRRKHITEVIKRINIEIKKFNEKFHKKVLFGVSPFGIWMNKKNDFRGSNTASMCSQSYDNQYADTYLWVKEGYIDYIVPQIYWEFGHKIAPFADLVRWWNDLVKNTNVDLYIGHGAYRLGNDGEYENEFEIVNQVKFANNFDSVKGNVFFTYHTFIDKGRVEKGMSNLKKLLNGGQNEKDL